MGTNYNPRMVTDGLVLCLDAANPRSYPGTGATWSDLSGNGNHGTLVNGPSYSSNNNGSMSFDGVDDYINLPEDFRSDNTQPFTVSMWASSISFGTLFGQQNQPNPGTATGWVPVFVIKSDGKFRFEPFWTGSSSNNITTTSAYNDGNYYNFVGTFSGSVANLYINGEFMGTRSGLTGTNYKTTAYYYFLGAGRLTTTRDPNPDPFINANISFFNFYNRVLSESEIKQNFETTRDRYGI